MIRRSLKIWLEKLLPQRPAVVLFGTRQVGKTTLALDSASAFESTWKRLAISQGSPNPEFYFDQHRDRLAAIDEIQREPDLFPIIRSQIDRNRRAGRTAAQCLLLGSASNDLLKQSSESLADRVSYQELRPFMLNEVGGGSLNNLWIRGGFPDAYLEIEASSAWRRDFIRAYLEPDVPALGI